MRTSFSSCIADSNTGKISGKSLYFSQENLKMSIFVQNERIIFPFGQQKKHLGKNSDLFCLILPVKIIVRCASRLVYFYIVIEC